MRELFVCCLFAVMISACGAVNVSTEVDNDVDFSGFSSFAWLQTDSPPGDDVRVDNSRVAGIVRAAVEKRLHAMGYEKKENGDVDFFVTWFGAIEKKVHVQSIDHFYASYGYGAVASKKPLKMQEGAQLRQYEEGTIIIDVLIPKTHKVYWRGIGTDRLLKDMDREDVKIYIGRIVHQILKNFPAHKI